MSDPQVRSYWRLLNRDGTFNVSRKGMPRATTKDLYHRALSTSWRNFLICTALAYFLANTFYAFAYFLAGPATLHGTESVSTSERLLDCFFFSVQTIGTIGYGKIYPETFLANIIVTFETITGILMFAVITGLVFSRFSRPTARVRFSEKAIITDHEGVPSLIFRIANERLNQIAEAHLSVTLVRGEVTVEGESYRTFSTLKLERDHSPVFALTWTVVHPITPESPLHGMGAPELMASEAEIMVTMTGMDDTFAQPIHARTSYICEDIVWNHRFEDMLSREDGLVAVDLSKLHSVVKL